MAHKHQVYDSDKHFIINPITRVAKTDPSHKTMVIQFDHNSERFTFELPRYIEGHDMTECNKVEVHYLNVDTKTKDERRGVYISDDLQVSADDENVVVCSLLISGNATELVGTLSFVVRYCCVEGDVVTYAWNTAVATVNVSTGINGSDVVIAEYADVLEKWKAELFNAGYINADTMQANISDLSNALNVERKRIDNIVALPNGSTTGDAELMDGHVDFTGKTWDNIGGHIRGVSKGIYATIDYNNDEVAHLTERSSNLWNPKKAEIGRLSNGDGTIDNQNESYVSSGFVKLPKDSVGKYVQVQFENGSISYNSLWFYDRNKEKIAGANGTFTAERLIKENYVFVRASVVSGKDIYFLGISETDEPFAEIDRYSIEINSEFLNDTKLKKKVENKVNIDGVREITPKNTTFFTFSSNMFDGTKYVGRLLEDGSVDNTQTEHWTSDFINIKGNAGKFACVENEEGKLSGFGLRFYDDLKNVVSGGYQYSFTTAWEIPADAVYVRFSQKDEDVAFFGINAVAEAMPFEKYDARLNAELTEESKATILPNWYAGKKAAALGDSITDNGETYTADDGRTGSAWREFVAQMLGLKETIHDCGAGGSKVSGVNNSNPAMWTDKRMDAIPEDIDILFFNGGMNDWGGNVALGDENSSDTNTFYGALNVIAKKLTMKFPTTIIFWMTTTYGYKNDSDCNNIGLTQYDYGRAIKKVAEKNGFPCIDLHSLCGWNRYNISNYVNDEGGVFIHPNRNGGRKIATAICSVVKNYQPCTIE